jgi:DNA-binding MarR family transcriptional regulator
LPEHDDLSQELRTGVGRLHRRFRSLRADSELGDAAVDVLLVLRKHGPLSLKALSDHHRVKPPTMSQIVNRLAADAYLERRPDPDDGRRVLLALTPAGDALAQRIRRPGLVWFDAQLAELSPDERTTLAEAARILQRLADS